MFLSWAVNTDVVRKPVNGAWCRNIFTVSSDQKFWICFSVTVECWHRSAPSASLKNTFRNMHSLHAPLKLMNGLLFSGFFLMPWVFWWAWYEFNVENLNTRCILEAFFWLTLSKSPFCAGRNKAFISCVACPRQRTRIFSCIVFVFVFPPLIFYVCLFLFLNV